MPKNKKAQSTVKDLMIIAIFIFSFSAFTLSIYNHHQLTKSYSNQNPTGYFMFHIPHWLHGHNSPNNRNKNMEMPTKMFHPREYKYNGPLTQQQVVEQTPAYHILKDIYTIINGKYYPISTKEGYINGSLISGDLDKINLLTTNKIQTRELCVNNSCINSFSNISINGPLHIVCQYGDCYSKTLLINNLCYERIPNTPFACYPPPYPDSGYPTALGFFRIECPENYFLINISYIPINLNGHLKEALTYTCCKMICELEK